MTFLSIGMLIGLAAMAIPILIHLLNRRKAQVVDWGAMQFLLGSLVSRNRRILIEEILLLALRCLLLGLLALAMARPFVPAGARTPWVIIVPAALLIAAALGTGTALWRDRRWRWSLYGLAAAVALIAALVAGAENWLHTRRWAAPGGEQDVAIVIDASASMTLSVDGKPNFDRALEEARATVRALRRNDAVSVVLAGPKPMLAVAVPTIDRELVLTTLDRLAPVGGPCAVVDALHAAAISLAEGQNTSKRIVFITDNHAVGWESANRVRWDFLAATLKDLPGSTRVVCRTLPLPGEFRNAAITELAPSREIIGLDRPVAIDLQVENTGGQPFSPFDVELRIDGKPVGTRTASALAPGTNERIRFLHQFDKAGLHTIRAHAAVRDDLPLDNDRSLAVKVLERLPVLLVDGSPAERPSDRASWYLNIALALESTQDSTPPGPSAPKDKPRPSVIDATVVNATDLGPRFDFAPYRVVILANVPQLPERIAANLAEFVAQGGGLLVAPGDVAAPAFYNDWRTAQGLLLCPARFTERKTLGPAEAPVKPALSTFATGPLALLADDAHSDIGTAAVRAWWRLAPNESAQPVSIAATLETGDPFLLEHSRGKGHVFVTALPLDITWSNLPTLQSFVPLVHEMVNYLARRAQTSWDFEPASELTLNIEGELQGPDSSAGRGLRGEYFDGHDWRTRKFTRVDRQINFNWPERPAPGVQPDNFAVRWTGSVIPRFTEPYTFYLCADDRAQLSIDGAQVLASVNTQEQTATVSLTAGRRHDVSLVFFEGQGVASVYLAWSSPSQPREVVPQSCLLPFPARWQELRDAPDVPLTTPDGSARKAQITAVSGALAFHVRNAVQPGLYVIRPPDALHDTLAGIASDDGSVPFTVRSDPEESRLTALTPADLDAVAQAVPFFHAEKPEMVIAAVSGGVPGSEFWKYLAVAALIAVLAEVALARWISVQRRAGSTETVRFTANTVDPDVLRTEVRRRLEPEPSVSEK